MRLLIPFLIAPYLWAVAPTANAGSDTTVRAGQSFTLDGSASTGTAPLTYFWQIVSSPSGSGAVQLATPTQSTTTVSGVDTFGQYTFRLTVTNTDGSDTTTVNIGSVSTDSNGVVILPSVTSGNGDLSTVLGQITIGNGGPWTTYDTLEGTYSDSLGANMPATYPGSTPQAGTLTVTNGSASITGSGTSFTSVFACNGTDWILIYYPLNGGGTGRREYIVSACADDTHLTTSLAFVQDPGATNPASNVQFGYMSNSEYGQWRGGSNNWNYYDVVKGLYTHYYRTGITKYLTYARTMADNFWTWPLDGGRCVNNGNWVAAPRLSALQGMMLRAMDNPPADMWAGLLSMLANYHSGWYTNALNPAYPTNMVLDAREQGYTMLFDSLQGVLDPTGSNRTTALGYGADMLTYLSTRQQPDGSFWEVPGGNDGVTGNGLSPWRSAFLVKGLRAYDTAVGSSAALTQAKNLASFCLTYGYANTGTCRGTWYSTFYNSCNSNAAHGDTTPTATGTVAVTNGDPNIVGTGTNFNTAFYASGASYAVIAPSTANSGDDYIGIPVSTITDATHMTLASGYTGATESGRPIYKGLTCDVFNSYTVQHLDTDCPATPTRGMSLRTISGVVHELAGWMYLQTGDTTYTTTGDDLFSANLAYGQGPGQDGGSGNFNDFQVYGITTAMGKYYGETLGAGGAPGYLAYRLGGLAPADSVDISLDVKIDAVANATKVRYTITSPNGATATTTCTVSPCTVMADARQAGIALVTIEYLDMGNSVLATGMPQQIPIQ